MMDFDFPIDKERLAAELNDVELEGGYFTRSIDVIVVKGEDRVRFLNGQVTCELKNQEILAAPFGYFTSNKGRIESEVMIQVDAEELRLILPVGLGEKIAERLRKYIITDRVELAVRSTLGFYVIGAAGLHLLDPLGIAMPDAPFKWVPYELQYQLQTLMRLPDLGIERNIPCVLLIAEDHNRNADTLARSGLLPLGEEAYLQLRIEAGWPLFGEDYNHENFPQEVGLDDAVSYTKGCYLGQEVVARIHYRGGVQRQLRGLRIEEKELEPPLGTALLLLDDKEVGQVRSWTPLPCDGAHLGLAIVHNKAEPGSMLELIDEGGKSHGHAQVIALPFPALLLQTGPDDGLVN